MPLLIVLKYLTRMYNTLSKEQLKPFPSLFKRLEASTDTIVVQTCFVSENNIDNFFLNFIYFEICSICNV